MLETWAQLSDKFWSDFEKAQRQLVQMQLEKRFGPLSDTARDRRAKVPAHRLEDLGVALLTAQSLKDLRLED